MNRAAQIILAACLLILAGCKEEVATPEPLKLTREAIGLYCNMIVADHPGPKIQVHEKGSGDPKWFSSVRDGLAYTMLPGEAQHVTAIYVHDMGQAASWQKPQDEGIWIAAHEAVYVIGSKMRGGMGAMEAVPFLDRNKAAAFANEHGGEIVSYQSIPRHYILGDEADHAPAAEHQSKHKEHGS